MSFKKVIKKISSFIYENALHLMLINLFIGYLTLFIAFLMVVIDNHTHTNSEWFLENFLTKLSESQEHLGKDFEKVLHENLWDLYES